MAQLSHAIAANSNWRVLEFIVDSLKWLTMSGRKVFIVGVGMTK